MAPVGTGEKGQITHLLVDWSEGDLNALKEVLPLAFEDLRSIARRCCSKVPSKEVQPTELIGEIYSVLIKQRNVSWDNRGQFYKFAALLMERVLLEHKRSLDTRKRGREFTLIPLADTLSLTAGDGCGPVAASAATAIAEPASQGQILDALTMAVDVTAKLTELAEIDPLQADVARLRYLTGLTIEETAETLGVSPSKVTRDWKNAKRILAAELEGYVSE